MCVCVCVCVCIYSICPTLCVCLWFTVSRTAAESPLRLLPSWTAEPAPWPHRPERWGVWFAAASQTKSQQHLMFVWVKNNNHASQNFEISNIYDKEYYWLQCRVFIELYYKHSVWSEPIAEIYLSIFQTTVNHLTCEKDNLVKGDLRGPMCGHLYPLCAGPRLPL